MDELPVEVIRKSTRDIVVKHRQVLREQESDIHRNMDTLCISLDNEYHAIINKLKTKRSISASELCIVKNNLMDASNNIDLVLNTHGALRGLVRELSGHDAAKQTIAAGCLCNLALGDTQASLVIAKAAGPYLIAALDNLATELAVTCAWTVGNLAGSGHKVCELLITQGSLNKLIGLLHSSNEEMKSAAEYAVTHFVYQMKDNLSTNHLSEIIRESLKSDLTNTSSQIIFFLSCHEAFTESVPIDSFLPKLFQELTISLKYHSESCEKADFCCKLVYVIRILSNLQRDVENYNCIMNYFTRNNLELDFIRILSTDSECLVDSLLWLLGNLYEFQNNEMFFSKLLQ